MPAICNITVENDADFYCAFAYQDLSGNPVDLTGATSMIMKVRREVGDVIAILELSIATGEIVITDPVNGLFTITIWQKVLIELALGAYVHSLIVNLNGINVPMWSGSLTINAGPSR